MKKLLLLLLCVPLIGLGQRKDGFVHLEFPEFVQRGDSLIVNISLAKHHPYYKIFYSRKPSYLIEQYSMQKISIGEYDSLGNGKYVMKGENGVDFIDGIPIYNDTGVFKQRANRVGRHQFSGIMTLAYYLKGRKRLEFLPFKGDYLVFNKVRITVPEEGQGHFIYIDHRDSIIISCNDESLTHQFTLDSDNPIKVGVAGYQPEDIKVMCSRGILSTVNRRKGEYIFNSSDKGNAIISIFVREKGKSKKIHSLDFNVH